LAGSSVRGLLSTTIIQIVALALLPLLVDWQRPNALWRGVNLLLLCTVALPIIQLLPLHAFFGHASGSALPQQTALTLSMERTAESLLYILPCALLVVVSSRFSENDFNRVLPFLYLGLLANIVFGLVQFAARTNAGLSPGFLPYEARAGFFANPNHFATLMFVAIPMVIYQFQAIRRPVLSLAAVAVILLASFATRSVAGVFLSMGCALFSYAAIVRMSTPWRAILIAAALAGMVVLSLNPGNILEIRADDPLDRMSIWGNSIEAVLRHLPLGSGLGTFDLVYPSVEAGEDIRTSFINHAHNEYLELLVEGGAAAGLLLLGYLVALLLALWRLPPSPLRAAAFCGVAFMLLHSVVEYPLRNLSLALVFGFLNAIVFSPALTLPRARQRP
jgi:O-antigen ligase